MYAPAKAKAQPCEVVLAHVKMQLQNEGLRLVLAL